MGKTKNSIIFLLITVFITLSFDFAFNPLISILSNQNGLVKFKTSSIPNNTGHFYLFEDGNFSTVSITQNQYPASNVGFKPKVFFNKSYDPQPPTLRTTSTDTTTLGTTSNPKVNIAGNIQVGTSWNPTLNIENYFILAFENKTNTVQSGCIEYFWHTNDASLNIAGIIEYNNWVHSRVISSYSGSNMYNKKIKWDFDSLQTGEQRLIYIPMTSKVKKNGTIQTGARKSIGCESGTSISSFNLKSAGAPHDPNVKNVFPECIYSNYDSSQKLLYHITFQNEGNAPAQNVIIKDVLDTQFLDISTLNFIDSEYPYNVNIIGNEIEIVFDEINLPGLNQTDYKYTYDQTLSHISFEICTYPLLPDNICIENQADIYFDNQPPITTNISESCCQIECQDLSLCSTYNSRINTEQEKNSKTNSIISIVPNPNNGLFTLKGIDTNYSQLSIFGLSGKKLPFEYINYSDYLYIDMLDAPRGIYVLKLLQHEKVITKKFILN